MVSKWIFLGNDNAGQTPNNIQGYELLEKLIAKNGVW